MLKLPHKEGLRPSPGAKGRVLPARGLWGPIAAPDRGQRVSVWWQVVGGAKCLPMRVWSKPENGGERHSQTLPRGGSQRWLRGTWATGTPCVEARAPAEPVGPQARRVGPLRACALTPLCPASASLCL